MSRIRIVKGKITEIIGGDLCYYSEGDIVEIAAETYSEKSAGKILYGDNPRKPLSSPTLTKCACEYGVLNVSFLTYSFDAVLGLV